jgi:outer membrane protein
MKNCSDAAAAPSSHRTAIAALATAVALGGCHNPFFTEKNYLNRTIPQEETREVQAVELRSQSTTAPVTVEEAVSKVTQDVVEPPPPPEQFELSLADVRAAALENNLDLKVELFNPSIAQATLDAERAKFESAFFINASRTDSDTPVALQTEGSQFTFDSINAGVSIPLRTGGTVTVALPLTHTDTNNPFATLDPSYTADLAFSISQPLLQGAGVNVNTHSIRVASYQETIVEAQTKLEAIRILANADRAYWRLYASRRELEVRQQQYELAVAQLERAKRRVAAGDVAQIEVTRAESGVASSLQAIITAQAAVRRTQRDLKRIINREDLPINQPTAIITTTQPQPLGLTLDGDALADFAVTNRMEMLELELQLAMDASTIDFRRNAKLPLVTLDYQYNYTSLGGTFGQAFDQLGEFKFDEWTLGVQATIPIGNEAAKSLYHQAILQRLQRLNTREQREVAIRQEVLDALDTLDESWQRILAARQESVLEGRTYDAERRQFDVGLRTSTDVLDAAARLADAQSREVLALAEYQIAQVDIAFATGTLLGHDRVQWTPTETSEY